MKYLIKKSDGSVSILIQNIENMDIEQEIAKWPEEDKQLVTGYRIITDKDLPANREFRAAWCDETESNKVDIDLNKAKQIKLFELRSKRDNLLKQTDIEYTIASELEDLEKIVLLKIKRKNLRDATEPLKGFIAQGYNDEAILNKIKELGELKII